jgi:hypothetical protein
MRASPTGERLGNGQRRPLAPSIKEAGSARALTDWTAMTETWGDHLPRATYRPVGMVAGEADGAAH